MKATLIIPLSIILFSCTSASEPGGDNGLAVRSGENAYAEHFAIRELGEFTLLSVFNPWQSSRGETYDYLLGREMQGIPDSLSHIPFIRIPVERTITFSTTHVAMLCQLDQRKSISGASNTEYIYDPELRRRIRQDLIREVGFEQALDYESIVSIAPDVLFIYSVDGAVTSVVEKLKNLDIPVVYCAEYLEKHPLGKAEWIRFIASFFGKDQAARQFFSEIDSSYRALVDLSAGIRERPEVMIGLPWKNTWYIPGGNSYASRLIGDAGGDYLWKDHPSQEAVAMDLDSVFEKAVRADIWINPGAAADLNSILSYDPRFELLKAVNNGRVYNNNARMSPEGGNDYWESGTVRPDLILSDLIAIMHPDLLPDHKFIYYKELK